MFLRSLLFLLLAAAMLPGQYVPNQYIVELYEEAAPGNLDRLTRLRARQSRVESQLLSRGYRTMARTQRVANALIVEVPEELADPASLAAQIPDVKRVHRVREFQKTLDGAARVHAVVAAWEQYGRENGGAGIKIGILDSGIEIGHPGFQQDSLEALDGFPRVNDDRDLEHTNRKIIVARSYASLFRRPDPETSALDRSGHGTAVAMAAAGVGHESPQGWISGMAPAARLGVYKIFGTPGVNDGATDAAILKAIEDAVADGMDIINLSFGSSLAARPEDDILVQALAQAEAQGVMAIVSAGNDGPGPATIGSPATAPTALTVGASENSRLLSSALLLGTEFFLARAGSRTAAEGVLEGQLVSVLAVDKSELACEALPDGVFAAKLVLVQRGECTFELKIANIARTGAAGVVLYSDAARANDLITPAVGAATLPTVFLTHADGLRLRGELSGSGELPVTIDLALKPRAVDPNRLAGFSSRGPLPGVPLKPDVLAVGTNFFTAAQSNYPAGDLYSATRYTTINGTSFSSPVAAGIAALLKSHKPGFSPAQYRSLLIHSARPLGAGSLPETGTGLLDLSQAMAAPLSIHPATVTFPRHDVETLELRNLTAEPLHYEVSIDNTLGHPVWVSASEVNLEPGGTAELILHLDRNSLDAGVHSGFILLAAEGLPSLRVPYWFGKANPAAPEQIQSLLHTTSASSGTLHRNLLFFRVLDANGISIRDLPKVSLVSGDGQVLEVQRRDSDLTGAFGLDLLLGPGTNVVEVDAGNGLVRRFSFLGR